MTKSQVNKLILLFTVTYMVSYITRINYGAIISEMVTSTKLSKSLLSLSLTGSFITYGTGQIISGICGDRFQPKRLVFLGLIVTSLMNILIPFCGNPYLMLAVWCVNGFAQAFMWPPIVRLMSTLFSESDYSRASVVVSFGSSFGTIAIYLLSPLIISILSWKAVFWCSACCSLIMAAAWQKFCLDIPKAEKAKKQSEDSSKKNSVIAFLSPLMLVIMAAIACQGALRDSVTTWMPSYISDTYNMSNSISILTGVILPIFSIISFQIAASLYRGKFKNPLSCAGVIFAVGTISALVLSLVRDQSVVLSVVLSALLTGCMHGVNLMLICMIPPFFKNTGNVSTVSGLLNSCTYVGSAASTYGIALVSENFGWQSTIVLWCVIAALGTLLCLVAIPGWKRKHET